MQEEYIYLGHRKAKRQNTYGRNSAIVRVSLKAYDYLQDIVENSDCLSVSRAASLIIEQAVEKGLARFGEEEEVI